MAELLNCPFCGGPASKWDYEDHDGDQMFGVACGNDACKVELSSHGSSQEEAVAAWNRRTPSNDARDAERYRWLRERGHPDECDGITVEKERFSSRYGHYISDPLFGEAMDYAIDSAIAADKGAEGGGNG